jgi:hypothetical protein
MVPLGYQTKDRRIVAMEEEAERVRTIFRRYLELGSLNRLSIDLRQRGIVTKVRSVKAGRTIGGIPFTRGPLAHLLRNRFYLGEVVYRGEVFPGEQPAILDRELFDAVQAKLDDQRSSYRAAYVKSESLLIGRIHDDRGNRMSPSHARKHGIRYRYYVSSAVCQGQPGLAPSVRRVPAMEVETLVARAVREHLKEAAPTDDRDLVTTHVVRVEVHPDRLVVELKPPPQGLAGDQGTATVHNDESDQQEPDRPRICVPWQKRPSKRRREIIVPQSAAPRDVRPIRAETRAKLVASIARGRRWLEEILAGAVTGVEQIAAREKCSIRKIHMTISLAFLAPDLVKAAIEGRLPHGIGIARLCDAPACAATINLAG